MVNDLRGTFRGFDAPVRRHPVAPLLQRSAALALCCASTLLFNRSPAPLHRRPAAPARWRSMFSGAPLLRHSGAPLHQHSTAPASRYSGVLLLKRSVAPALQCSTCTTAVPCRSDALLLQHSATPLLRHCDAPALRYSVNSRGAGARGWRARSAHQNRVTPPHSNTQATLADMRSTVRRVSQKEISLAVVGVTHAL